MDQVAKSPQIEMVVWMGKLWGWCLNGDRRHSWRWDKDWPRNGPSYTIENGFYFPVDSRIPIQGCNYIE